jgi:MoxR-like ATPase
MRLADAQAASLFLPPLKTLEAAGEDRPRLVRERLRSELPIAVYVRPGPLWWAFDWDSAQEQAARSGAEFTPPVDGPKNGRVVLIDEIDKADSDLPNGLLEALGAGEFSPQGRPEPVRIVEPFPLVVITTNEERLLPAAFVRRCFVLHLSRPDDRGKLEDLLVGRAAVHFPHDAQGREPLFRKAAALIAEERDLARRRFVKPLPGQAEFLDLVRAVLELGESASAQMELIDSIAHFVLKKQELPGA